MATLSKQDRATQAAGAKDAAAEAASGPRVASLDELLAMDQADLDQYLAERGSAVDWERLDDRALLWMGTDAQAIDRGVELSPARMDRVRENVEKALVSIAREEANTLMAAEEQRAMFAADPRPREQQFGRWCCICSGSCDDCISFHGAIYSMDYWEGISPSDGVNACEKKCRCRILPVADPGAGNEGLRNQ